MAAALAEPGDSTRWCARSSSVRQDARGSVDRGGRVRGRPASSGTGRCSRPSTGGAARRGDGRAARSVRRRGPGRLRLRDGRRAWTCWSGSGRGPGSRYPDRGAGARVGHHSVAVDDLFTPYLRPQESGGRHGVRRFTLSAPDATGLTVALDEPRQVSVTRYRAEDLTAATHHDELVPRAGCVVHIDAAHRGLGTASCGPDTFPSYRVAPGIHRWSWTLRALTPTAPPPPFPPPSSPPLTLHGAHVCTSHAPQPVRGRAGRCRTPQFPPGHGAARRRRDGLGSRPLSGRGRTRRGHGSTGGPTRDSRRFTLAVMPDTQYLFDGPSIDKAPVEASLRYLLEHGREENIVFLSHLGDLTQNGSGPEVAAISEAFAAPGPAGCGLQRPRRQPRREVVDGRPARCDAVSGRLRAEAVPGEEDVRGRLPRRLQHLPPLQGRRPRVDGARAGLAAVGQGLRLGQGRPRRPPEDAGRPHHA